MTPPLAGYDLFLPYPGDEPDVHPGHAALDSCEYAKAEAIYRDLLLQNPNDGDCHWGLRLCVELQFLNFLTELCELPSAAPGAQLARLHWLERFNRHSWVVNVCSRQLEGYPEVNYGYIVGFRLDRIGAAVESSHLVSLVYDDVVQVLNGPPPPLGTSHVVKRLMYIFARTTNKHVLPVLLRLRSTLDLPELLARVIDAKCECLKALSAV